MRIARFKDRILASHLVDVTGVKGSVTLIEIVALSTISLIFLVAAIRLVAVSGSVVVKDGCLTQAGRVNKETGDVDQINLADPNLLKNSSPCSSQGDGR